MPFVAVRKARTPAWQDTRPRARAHADAYKIADKHFRRFAQAYERAVGKAIAAVDLDRLLLVLARGGDASAIAAAIPWYDPRDSESAARWRKLEREFEATYRDIVQESGTASLARLDVPMRFDLDNPYSVPWIERQGAELVTRIGEEGRDAIREAVARGFELGNPPREMARTIRASIGLRPDQTAAVQRRLALHLAAGLDPVSAATRAAGYAQKLLSARALLIARTETIAAEAQGTLDSWRDAGAKGFIVPGTKKRWIEAKGSERTCAVCEDLGAQDPIDLDASWTTITDEEVEAPPSHPACRCSLGLVIP